MSEHKRCVVCGNLAPYCPCGNRGTIPQGPPPKTRYQKHYEEIVAEECAYGGEYEPTPSDFVAAALAGYSVDGAGVWLCRRGCAVTTDPECDYGGWHGDKGHESDLLHIEINRGGDA